MLEPSEPSRNGEALAQVVLDWQRPLYNLAYRMLGNEADAADATQEIFITVLRNFHRYDSRRALKPWIYRVATSVLRNFIRDSKLRRQRESEAPMKRDEFEEKERLEHRELEAVVEGEIAKLPEASRSLILLHYYQGLSQFEVAEALAISRTTAQTRIQKALKLLKRGLATAGYLSVVPNVESLMRSSAALHVPAKLSASLMTIAANATSTATISTGLTLGGILMTKQIIGGALILGIVSLGAGLWAGRTILRADGAAPSLEKNATHSDAASVSKAEFEKLKADYARTIDALHKKEAEARTAQDALASADRARLASSAELAPSPNSAVKAGDGKAKLVGPDAIDWTKFAELLANNVDLLAIAMKDENKLTPEQQAKMAAMLSEYMKLVAQVKTASPVPFFDPKILPDYVHAMFSKSLGLTESQLAELDKTTRSLLAGRLSELDPSTALPVELYRARMQLISDITNSVNGMLTDSQRAQWDAIQNVSGRLMRGDESIGDIGMLDDVASGKYAENVYQQWDWAYSFDESQQGAVRSVAASYTTEAERLLRDYGQYGANPRALSPTEQARLYEDFFVLQARMEREFHHVLTPEQLELMRRHPPAIIRFHYGSSSNTSRNTGNSF
ncbi:MAG: sigma-70 family RNA polymerase sigma factor [Planctomycetes bacterium]|nr:sigma-70 family RNA polymerase sigma factor [Planctomycetota bacterium]